MTLTLQKQRKININMSRFIEYILYSYRLKKQYHLPQQDGRTFYDEIYYAVLVMTHTDIRDYDNSLYTMQTIIKNAYTYATENDYSQADINMLKEIIDLL